MENTAKFPETLTDIGSGAFAECSSLETVILPEGLTKIWDIEQGVVNDMMYKMSSLKTEGAFMFGTNLKSVTIPESLT